MCPTLHNNTDVSKQWLSYFDICKCHQTYYLQTETFPR